MKIYILVSPENKGIVDKYVIPKIHSSNLISIDIPTGDNDRTLIADCRDFLINKVNYEGERDCIYLCSNKDYFRALTGKSSSKSNGFKFDSTLFKDCYVFFIEDPAAFYKNSNKYLNSINISIKAINNFIAGTYNDPGYNIIHSCRDLYDIKKLVTELHRIIERNKPITIDIETTGLKHFNSYIVSVGIGYDEHRASVIYNRYTSGKLNILSNLQLSILKEFFKLFKGKTIYHKVDFDVTMLISHLFMKDKGDYEGLLEGLDVMLSNWDCTRLIAYLATNNCSNNDISLKTLAQPFAGDWGEDNISDVLSIPADRLVKYNAKDSLSTWYVHNKYYPIMIKDKQNDIYENIFKPAIKDIIQMQLTGMPVNYITYNNKKNYLRMEENSLLTSINSSPVVKEYTNKLIEEWVIDKNSKLKRKRVTSKDCDIEFSVTSTKQLRGLLYDYMGLPVIDHTKSKLASTSSDTIDNLTKHTEEPEYVNLLNNISKFRKINKLNNSFIPAIGKAYLTPIVEEDNITYWHFLYGDFNLGGTVSGRLSSSSPNLQNIPSSTELAEHIKEIFEAPPGWLFVGADFWSLEDRISALTTKDINKLKVYMGHVIYEVCVNGTIHHVRDDAIINFDGKSYTGGEFYDTFGSL